MTKQYIYIVQAALEPSKCKIGKTDNLDRRLKEYSSMTGTIKNLHGKDNVYKYLYTCEVKDMSQVEGAIKKQFPDCREDNSREIYFCNNALFRRYVEFIKSHKLFVNEIFIKAEDKKQIVKIVQKTIPSLRERGLTSKDIMQRAKRVGNDEFYTQYEDVEKELSMYPKSIWKNKTVFCNCDDPVDDDERNSSAFPLYFLLNFRKLGLKKLICTHYAGAVDLFNQGPKGYVYTYIFTKNGYEEIKDYPVGYNGSFDHPLSLKILHEEADIVCTNPPFSRTRDFWKILIESGKKFLIISNVAIILTASYIPYFYNRKVWAGYNEVDWFLSPKKELTRAAGFWFTNLPIKNRPRYKQLKIMRLKDIPEKHKRYDDSKILLVDNNYIPSDYKKPFAVSARAILNGLLEQGYELVQDKEYYPYINREKKFARVLVQKK